MELDSILHGIEITFSFYGLLAMLIGSIFGMIMGALPGASATMAMAILVPITYYYDPELSLLLLVSVYTSGIFGGSITAILINIPGTAASAATCYDGHPMAKQGKAGKAIAIAIVSSLIGGTVGALSLMLCAPALAAFALKFGAAETMMIALFGLTMVASLSSENLAKGLLMGTLGMFLGSIGLDSSSGFARFTFGNPNLLSGINSTAVLIGVFSIPEVIKMLTGSGWKSVPWDKKQKQMITFPEFMTIIKTCGVPTAIGIIVGIIPALGPETATFMGYDSARRMAKPEEKASFGKGNIKGVIASEAAKNAVVGASLAPTLALGIPGSTAAMVLMSGLMIQGLTPGPTLFMSQKGLLGTIYVGLLVAQFFMFAVGFAAARLSPYILKIKAPILGPCVLIVCMVGTFAIRNDMFDLYVMFFSGVLAYFLGKVGFSPVPLVLGMILGPHFDANLNRSIMLSSETGWLSYMLGRPIALVILGLTILTIVLPLVLKAKGSKDTELT
jgi:putative tricarboxylic transport membrane protein